MNSQALYNISQLNHSLKKHKYKAVLAKVERLIEQMNNDCFSQQYLFLLYMTQISAINKLFKRNLLNKYKYEPKIIDYLINLLTYNLEKSQDLLVDLLQINTDIKEKPFQDMNPPQFSLLPRTEQQNYIKREKIEDSNQGKALQYNHKYLQRYIKELNTSIINVVQMKNIYKKSIDLEIIDMWVKALGEIKFMKAGYLLSQAKMMLLLCKHLLTGGEEQLVRCQLILQKAVEILIDAKRLSHKARFILNGNGPKVKKYEIIQKDCFKLIIISMILTNRNNMKLQKEELATFGAETVCTIVQNITGNDFSMFRRFLNPQIYVHEQYLRYRIQKKEMVTLIESYFPEYIEKVQLINEEILQKRNKWTPEVSIKREKREARESNKSKLILEQLSTAKSICNERGKMSNNSTSILLRNSKQGSEGSKIYRDTLLSNFMKNSIEEIVNSYSKIKNKISIQTYRKPVPKIVKKEPPKTLKKQRISIKNEIVDDELYLSQKCKKICTIDALAHHNLKLAQNKLNKRMKFKILEEYLQGPMDHPAIILKQDIDNAQSYLNHRASEDNDLQLEETQLRTRSRNSNLPSKPSKVKQFIEILFINKNWLGIRKIAQKFELLKKKEQEKQKMLTNRLTSVVHQYHEDYNRRDNMYKLKLITEAVLNQHSTEERYESGESIDLKTQIENKKMVEANYILGQDSIEAVRKKLEKKMCKKQMTANRSQRNQEIFKQKLKSLGSKNFFFKRVEESTQQSQIGNQEKHSKVGNVSSSHNSIESDYNLRKKYSIGTQPICRSNFVNDFIK